MRVSRATLLLVACGAATASAVATVGVSALSVGVPALVFLGLFADGVVRPGSNVLYPTVTRGPSNGNRVALSFDDGPDPKVTPGVLDALAKYDARATFFTIGRYLDAHPQLARRIVAQGHELGNHSWRHSRWQNFFGADEQAREIERGARAIAAVTGKSSDPLYRPPIGLKSPPLARAASQRQLTVVAWSLQSRDTRTADPERIAQRVLERIRSGDIVLMHDGHDRSGRHRPACVQATSLILDGLRVKGLECTTVSELLNVRTARSINAAR